MGACTQKSGFFCIYMAIAISEMKRSAIAAEYCGRLVVYEGNDKTKRCEKIKITIVVELKLCLLYNDRNIRSIKGDENLKDETVKSIDEQGEIVIYQSEDGKILIDVKIEDETVWLTQQQMADLFQTSRTNVVEHIKHIYEEQELEENATCRNFRQVRLEGNREVKRNIPHYIWI
jgi:Virulence protein